MESETRRVNLFVGGIYLLFLRGLGGLSSFNPKPTQIDFSQLKMRKIEVRAAT